ncbi:MAG: PDZ domain-containing protein, partial [Planctomycetota bacterium]
MPHSSSRQEKAAHRFSLPAAVGALLVCVLMPRGGFGQQLDALQLLEKEQAALREAAAKANPYVVQIETFGGMERIGEDLVAEGPTTGTILTEDGWIVSSLYSFRQRPASILVSLPNGKRQSAEVVARDFSRQLTLLKVEPEEPLPHVPETDQKASAELSSSHVGSWVVALGKTYDKDVASQSGGIISAVGRAYGKAFQTDAKISPINYGGPLVDIQGRSLGILSPLSPGTFLEGDSSEIYDSGIGFAIPLADIFERLPTWQKGEDTYEGKLGVVTTSQNEMAGPVKVVGAIPGSPAGKAGLKAGDIINKANDEPIRLLADLKHAIAQVDAGNELSLEVYRKGKLVDGLSCELAKEIPVYRKRYLGLRLSKRLAEDEEGAEEPQAEASSALTISSVESKSPAAKAGLLAGDTLLSCDGEPLTSPEILRGRIAVAELEQDLVLKIRRGDEELEVALRPELWPDELPASVPKAQSEIPENGQCKIVDIALGDFTNKAFAVVPPLSDQRNVGLLMVYSEPGDVDREKTKEYWSEFATEQGWIVAVASSANPQRWSPAEIELAERILGR